MGAWSEVFNVAGVIASIGAVAAGAVAWLFGHDRRLSVLEAQREHMAAWLGRVESKLDRVIDRKGAGR